MALTLCGGGWWWWWSKVIFVSNQPVVLRLGWGWGFDNIADIEFAVVVGGGGGGLKSFSCQTQLLLC